MSEEVNQTGKHKKKKIALAIFFVLVIIAVIMGFFYLQYTKTHVSTDDAFVEGDIYTIASKVPGTVKSLYVDDNKFVNKGDLLVEIDPADYDAKLQEAASAYNVEKAKVMEVDARIEASKTMLSELNARAEAAKANLDLQEATLRQADIDIKRAESLYRKEAISKDRYDKTGTAHDVALAQVKAAQEQLKQARMAVDTQVANIKQAESQKKSQISSMRQKEASQKLAELNHSYTKIYSPSDGYVTKKNVEMGNQIQAGQPIMAVVPLSDVYIVANYKETQIKGITFGQRVKIEADSYPGRVFWGRVDSIMAGTGAAFSLFPPENATGNYVKVVQRIPVKIVLEKGTDTQHLLRVGMSVEPMVYVK